MSKILKNNTASPVSISDVGGDTVPASGQLSIDPANYGKYSRSDDIISLLADNTLTYNDGSSDLGLSDATNHLKDIFPSEISIQEEDVKTGGHYQTQSFVIDVPAQTGWHEEDISFPFPVSLLSAEWNNLSSYEGDQINLLIAADSTIGSLSSDANSSDTELTVSQSVIDNCRVGGIVKITDGVNTDDCGRILSKTSTTITVETALVNNYLASSPTYVKHTVEMLPESYLESVGSNMLGQTKIGGSYLPTGTVIKARYNNISGTAKKFIWWLEYLY
jgi:hypothetical protein